MNAMTVEKAQALLEKFPRYTVAVIGDVCLDQYVHGVVERLNPEAPVPILHAKEEVVATGCAGNVAKNLATLRAQAVLVSVVGNDESAEMLRAQAESEGYAANFLPDETRPTPRKIRHIVGSQQLLRVDYEEPRAIDDSLEEAVVEEIRGVIEEGAHAIIVSDYAKGVITQKVGQEVLDLAKASDVLLAVDAKPVHAHYFVGATLMSPNLKEAHEFLGWSYFDERQSPEATARAISKKFQTDAYVTLGADGMYVQTGKGVSQHFPQEHVAEVYDVSGAGDTALVTLVLALLAGASSADAAWLANAAGAVVVGKVGSVGVTHDALLKMVGHQHE